MHDNLSKRAQLRAQQDSNDISARRTKRIVVSGIVLAVVAAVVVLAIVISQAMNRPQASSEQLTPPNATAGGGIAWSGMQSTDDVPHLVIWGDYQCSACAYYESAFGDIITGLVADGSITAEARQATFLDGTTAMGPSLRSAIAAAAADEVGAYDAYHAAIFANQGTGLTDPVLRNDLPEQIGLTGDDLTRFQELYDGAAFRDFATSASEQFTTSGVGSTPTYLVGDTQLEFFDADGNPLIDATPENVLAAIHAAA